MDIIDAAILDALKENARASASQISKQVNLSVPAVAERIRKLESAGIIRGYTVRLDREKTGKPLLAFMLVNIDGTENIRGFRDAMLRQSDVLECHHVAGVQDYLLKVAAENMGALEAFISQTLKTIPGVAATNTMISLLPLKEEL
ncbi:MAG TPA: Lrp/AsnC family transcriptional regulator [Candidatus Limiplasma sp.]|nr:Lrp/AsnC family transcriptional regulator [Candidatus Limiplasma sp.]